VGKLTVKAVAALKDPGRYSDGDGLHLRIVPSGQRYWVLRIQQDGKRRDINLGSFPAMSLSTARAVAHKAREAGGKNRHAVPTFSEAAREAHKARTTGLKNDKHVAQWLTTLETYAIPVIGDMRIDEVERGDVHRVLEPIWMKIPETARRVLQRIDRVIRWAIGKGYRDDAIDMRLVRDALPRHSRRQVKHMASVPWQEVPAFHTAFSHSAATPQVRAALHWLILTASRPGNVRNLKWTQIDQDAMVWVVPADEMKMGIEHHVPLSPEAISLLQAGTTQSEYVFGTGVGKAMSLDTMRMAMRRMGYRETPHGFRTSFKAWSLANGWADHLSEAALAHADPNEVRAAYARENLLEERRPMMLAWAKFVTGHGERSSRARAGIRPEQPAQGDLQPFHPLEPA